MSRYFVSDICQKAREIMTWIFLQGSSMLLVSIMFRAHLALMVKYDGCIYVQCNPLGADLKSKASAVKISIATQ